MLKLYLGHITIVLHFNYYSDDRLLFFFIMSVVSCTELLKSYLL